MTTLNMRGDIINKIVRTAMKSWHAWNPNNLRSSSLQIEGNHVPHYEDEIEDATRYADEIELNFQRDFFFNEGKSITIEIVVDNIRLEAKYCNFSCNRKEGK